MLDFQKRKKKYFNITLHDGTKLRIPTPTLDLYEELSDLVSAPKNIGKEELQELVKAVLSTNKEKVEITDEQAAEFDLEDMYDFFLEYIKFVQGVLSDPNLNSPIAPLRTMGDTITK